MSKVTYSQVVSMICYYLEKYPSMAVALECVREDVEGDAKIARQVNKALDLVNVGKPDHVVIADWAKITGARDLETLAQRLEEAHEKGEDIGFYVKRFMPAAARFENRTERKSDGNKRRSRKNTNRKPRK